MAEKFPNLLNNIKPLIQAQRTLSRINTKKNTPKKIKVANVHCSTIYNSQVMEAT